MDDEVDDDVDGSTGDAGAARRRAAGRLVGGDVPAEDSATTVLLRDGAEGGLEVFLLERHLRSDYAGGAFVFPGGTIDDADRELDPARWDGIDLTAAATLVGAASEQDALALYVCAVRETFEEAGILLATRDGEPLGADELTSAPVRRVRARLNDRDDPFDWREWLADEGLVLDLGALALWSWWATPDGVHRRYDTRFFAAVVDDGRSRVPQHDAVETVSSRWMRPADALDAGARGEVTIIYPTRKNLEGLAGFADARSAWQACAAGEVDQRRIQPLAVGTRDGHPMVQHPDGGEPEPV